MIVNIQKYLCSTYNMSFGTFRNEGTTSGNYSCTEKKFKNLIRAHSKINQLKILEVLNYGFNKEDYNKYNLSIILCWLLLPTQRWGSKSLIARFHGCKHKNRVYRLIRFYEANKGFKSYVNEALKGYKCDN